MMWGWNWGWGGWIFMGLTMVIFWGLIVFGAIALFRYLGRGPEHGLPRHDGADQALRILDERLARGEIDPDEYTKRRDILRSR